MLYAIDDAGLRMLANPGATAFCPGCKEIVIAKCGEINIWHWAHRTSLDCDPWWEPESYWHRQWKQLVRPDACEVIIRDHRADIVGNAGMVIELQRSSISTSDIAARERTYGHMIWLFEASDYNLSFRNRKKNYASFRWKHPRKSQWCCQQTIFWDLGDGDLFHVRKLHANTPCGGWGYFLAKEKFIEQFLSKVLA